MEKVKVIIGLLYFLFSIKSQAQNEMLIHFDSLPQEGISLEKGWKWHAGDNPDFAKTDFDDSSWKEINPLSDIMDLKEVMEAKSGWLRLSFQVDSSLAAKALTLVVNKQSIAAEFYLNNELIGKIGVIGENNRGTIALSPPYNTTLNLPLTDTVKQVLAVRFAIEKDLPYNYNFLLRPNQLLSSKIIDSHNINFLSKGKLPNLDIFRGGLFLILFVLHLALYSYDPSRKANLYFWIYAIANALMGICTYLYDNYYALTSTKMYFQPVLIFFGVAGNLSFLTAAYELFHVKKKLIYWLLVITSVTFLFGSYIVRDSFWQKIFVTLIFAVVFEVIRISIMASLKKVRGTKIVVFGCLSYIVFFMLFYLSLWGYLPGGYLLTVLWNIGNLSIPIAISVYLALEASDNAKNLRFRLIQVEELSKEKEEILASQNKELDKQVKERTRELNDSLNNLKSTQAQLIQSEKMASLGELTAGIAHEIQNPLNFVNNFSEVSGELIDEMGEEIEKGDFEEVKAIALDVKENLLKIHHHGNRASSIVKGMLEHSRTSTGIKELTDINALADEYLRLAYHGLRAKDKTGSTPRFNAEMVTNFDPNLPKIEVIPQDIGRVLLNLINNGFQAVMEKASMPEVLEGRVDQALKAVTEESGGRTRRSTASNNYKPTVTVSTQLTAQGQLLITITDNGPGIPEEIKEKIFQPFFTTKPTGEGTGLGLSLAYDIVKAHGGEITVESDGAGTSFTIKLPII